MSCYCLRTVTQLLFSKIKHKPSTMREKMSLVLGKDLKTFQTYFSVCCDFAKLTLVKQSPECQMVNQCSTKDNKGIEIEEFVTHKSWRRHKTCLNGTQMEVKAGCKQSHWTWSTYPNQGLLTKCFLFVCCFLLF